MKVRGGALGPGRRPAGGRPGPGSLSQQAGARCSRPGGARARPGWGARSWGSLQGPPAPASASALPHASLRRGRGAPAPLVAPAAAAAARGSRPASARRLSGLLQPRQHCSAGSYNPCQLFNAVTAQPGCCRCPAGMHHRPPCLPLRCCLSTSALTSIATALVQLAVAVATAVAAATVAPATAMAGEQWAPPAAWNLSQAAAGRQLGRRQLAAMQACSQGCVQCAGHRNLPAPPLSAVTAVVAGTAAAVAAGATVAAAGAWLAARLRWLCWLAGRPCCTALCMPNRQRSLQLGCAAAITLRHVPRLRRRQGSALCMHAAGAFFFMCTATCLRCTAGWPGPRAAQQWRFEAACASDIQPQQFVPYPITPCCSDRGGYGDRGYGGGGCACCCAPLLSRCSRGLSSAAAAAA